jgi:hypothetical protein
MQLDKTRISIRERSQLELFDLALRVLREHAGPLGLAFLAGVLPIALVNHWLFAAGLPSESPGEEEVIGYMLVSAWLICWEAPLATAPLTLYLGQALFVEKPTAAGIAADLAAVTPQFVCFQVIVRGMLTVLVVPIPVLYLGWPYLTEIILLERNAWRKRGPRGTSTASRSADLHSRQRGELFVRWLGSATAGLLLIFILWRSLWSLAQLIIDEPETSAAQWTVWLPVAIWLVVGYFTIVRFLSYLDLRIRTEGWEVELLLRAEAARLARQLT